MNKFLETKTLEVARSWLLGVNAVALVAYLLSGRTSTPLMVVIVVVNLLIIADGIAVLVLLRRKSSE